jgi:hypothetical protein
MSVTITPTEERARLRIKDGRLDSAHIRGVVTRWLERAARKQGRHINEPSVTLSVDREVILGRTFLYVYADSFPDTLPDWLRTVEPVVEKGWRARPLC